MQTGFSPTSQSPRSRLALLSLSHKFSFLARKRPRDKMLLLTILLSFLPLAYAVAFIPQAQGRADSTAGDIISDILGDLQKYGLSLDGDDIAKLKGLQSKANDGLLDLCDAAVSLSIPLSFMPRSYSPSTRRGPYSLFTTQERD